MGVFRHSLASSNPTIAALCKAVLPLASFSSFTLMIVVVVVVVVAVAVVVVEVVVVVPAN